MGPAYSPAGYKESSMFFKTDINKTNRQRHADNRLRDDDNLISLIGN
jgi:hypothetical protein